MTKYPTSTWGTKIEQVNVLRETEKSIVVQRLNGMGTYTIRKQGMFHRYHDTWDAAMEYLLDRVTRSMEAAKRSQEIGRQELARLTAMKLTHDNRSGEGE